MLLNLVASGRGPRSALLVHGMCGSSESWGAVTDRLIDSGYRVLAVDLPGHGFSPRDEATSVSAAAKAVVETVSTSVSGPLTVAMGHSYGGSVLAAAVGRLRPTTAVYVDAGMLIRGGQDREALIEQYENDRRLRSQRVWLRRTRPYYDDRAIDAEARAAERFDPATMAAVSLGDDVRWAPEPGSIVVRANPSDWVTERSAADLTRRGVHVREIPGAAHTVWYSHLRGFVDALPEVFTG
ncbi:alpha/beta hydrolase [Microbacterium esteraromaticum]|nr:alpha/beta hydrolase [Microbacterium esteraromaticum]